MGQSVDSGEVLAEIDTPELDQELSQAEADLQAARVAVAQAEAELAEGEAILNEVEANVVRSRAELSLANKQLERRERLVARQALPREDLDLAIRDQEARKAEVASAEASVKRQSANLETRRAILASRKAMVHSRDANVRRLTQLQAFKRIEAPFPGVITRRNAEVGSLVTAGNSTGTPLFEMAQLDRVRVQVSVPQTDAQDIAVGTKVTILVPETPGQSHAGAVTRTSESLDSATRTLLVETELFNVDGRLKSGLYTQARFVTASDSGHWLIPNSALRMQVDGPHVVLADRSGRLTIRPIELGRDHGSFVTVLSGLNGDEQLVINPTDDLRDGMSVHVTGSRS
jgi:RND family efflux transporter MFP subunit